jgi:polyisoprenyl-phosphate glycosyltransferase
MKKKISVVTPCYNEEGNAADIYEAVKKVFAAEPNYKYEHLFIDNASKDQTVAILKSIAEKDKNVKIIVNVKNFGPTRSPYHAFLTAEGDAVVIIAADLQDPPELISEFLRQWEKGFKVVMGVKVASQENPLMYRIRKLYYRTLAALSDVELVENYTGFGLYDREVVETFRGLDELTPYFRGIIAELGFSNTRVEYHQKARTKGFSQNNFYALYDQAMLGLTNYSKVPLRVATMAGFLFAVISFLIGIFYLIYKLMYWKEFTAGSAPVVIGLFFVGSIQLFFLGIVGEYVGAIFTRLVKRPHVIEKERINF